MLAKLLGLNNWIEGKLGILSRGSLALLTFSHLRVNSVWNTPANEITVTCVGVSYSIFPMPSSNAAFHGKNCELPFDVCSNETQRCFNGGTCQPDGHYFTCTCPPNYTGERCEFVIDPCFEKPCLNDGRCVVSGAVQTNGHYQPNVTASCECSSGFSGEQCEVPPAVEKATLSISDSNLIIPCVGSFCRSPRSHTKKCMKDADDSLYCICEAGWGGERCDRDIDECFEKPCAKGERCTNVPGKYICTSAP